MEVFHYNELNINDRCNILYVRTDVQKHVKFRNNTIIVGKLHHYCTIYVLYIIRVVSHKCMCVVTSATRQRCSGGTMRSDETTK